MSAKPKSESSDHDGSDITNESSSNSTTSSSSQESWFKSLKRNLSSKRKGGKQARSGGNIRETSSQQAAGRLNKSEWDICHSGTELTGLDFTNVKMSEKSVVSGLDLAHSHQNKGTCLGARYTTVCSEETGRTMFYTMDAKRMAQLLNKPTFDKNLLHGIKQFNLDPSRGLHLLVQAGFVKMEAESLAEFMFNQERLSKKQIGGDISSLLLLCTTYRINLCRIFPRGKGGPEPVCPEEVRQPAPVLRPASGAGLEAIPLELQTAGRGPAD